MTDKKTKLKVLILSHSSELSGAELSMMDLFDYWVKNGWVEPHFIIRRPLKNMAPALQERNWPYTSLYYTNWSQRSPTKIAEHIYRGTLFNTKAIFAIEKVIADIKPDVVMTNTIVSPWAAIAAYFQRVPHIWFVREYGDADHQHVFEVGREKMFQDIETLSDLVVTNSKTLAKDLESLIDKSKLTTLYTPFDLEKLRAKGAQKITSPFKNKSSLKLVITGRIAPSKGQAQAAEAIGKLNQMGHDTELCVVGAPSQEEDANQLTEVIRNYDISDKVHLVGQQSNPLPFVDQADVGITASHREAFGRVTFEYMTLGKPVVGANSGATPEIIEDGKSGFLYELGSVDSLVEKLLSYAKDNGLAQKHGNAAAIKAEKMMAGQYNAETLLGKVRDVVSDKDKYRQRPLNYSHRWLEYPSVAEEYISDTGVIALHWIIYRRVRHWGKLLYLWVTSPSDKDRRDI